MKILLVALTTFVLSFASISNASFDKDFTCDNTVAGGDVWPWCLALPFPWTEIEGYWRMGEDKSSYIQVRIENSAADAGVGHKIVKIHLYNQGICSAPYASGTGSFYSFEKDVMQGLVASYLYRYQLKLAMFHANDVLSHIGGQSTVMGLSVWVVGETDQKESLRKLDGIYNVPVNKMTLDVDKLCNSNN